MLHITSVLCMNIHNRLLKKKNRLAVVATNVPHRNLFGKYGKISKLKMIL